MFSNVSMINGDKKFGAGRSFEYCTGRRLKVDGGGGRIAYQIVHPRVGCAHQIDRLPLTFSLSTFYLSHFNLR